MAKQRRDIDPELALALLLGQDPPQPAPKPQEPPPAPTDPFEGRRLASEQLGKFRTEVLEAIRRGGGDKTLEDLSQTTPPHKLIELAERPPGTPIPSIFDELKGLSKGSNYGGYQKSSNYLNQAQDAPLSVEDRQRATKAKQMAAPGQAKSVEQTLADLTNALKYESSPGMRDKLASMKAGTQSQYQGMAKGNQQDAGDGRVALPEDPTNPRMPNQGRVQPSIEERFALPQRNEPLELQAEREAMARGKQSELEEEYNTQSSMRDLQMGGDVAEIGKRIDADRMMEKEAAEETRLKTPPEPQTPYDRYLDMLSKDPEVEQPGFLDLIGTLGMAFGGARPGEMTGIIDQLRGGPQQREKMGRAKTAAELYVGRESAERDAVLGQQKFLMEEGGRSQRHQDDLTSRRSNLEYEQGAVGDRLEKQIAGDYMLQMLKGEQQPDRNALGNSDIRGLLGQSEEPIDHLLKQADDKLRALEQNSMLQMSQPEKYIRLKQQIAQEVRQLHQLKAQHRATFRGRMEAGDERGLYEPANTDPFLEEMFNDLEAALNVGRKK